MSSETIQLAPLRSLEDFILGSARFQIPQLNDLDRYNKRVINNLLYYQTNYCIFAILLFLLIGIMYPREMLLGLLALLVAIAIFIYANNSSPSFMEFKKSHPIISLLLIFGGGYLFVYLFSSVIIFLFGILLPVFLMLVHASLRLRNLKNKVTNAMETIGLTKTPMGLLLDSFGSEQLAYVD